MITINKDGLSIDINEKGGTLSSIKKDGIEYQWQGSEESWTGKDVVIFPFIARLKDGYYEDNGKRYEMKIHGLVRYENLSVEELSDSRVVMSLKWSNETLKKYPYKFEFYVIDEIIDGMLNVTYRIKNVDNKPIYFEVGGHPAFQLPLNRKEGYDDISGNVIEFDKELTIDNYELDETGGYITELKPFGKMKSFELTKELFRKYKTLLLTNADFNQVVLKRKDGVNITMKVNEPKVLAFWSNPTYGSYICIEPWIGIPDFNTPIRELKNKKLMNKLNTDLIFEYSYSIKI